MAYRSYPCAAIAACALSLGATPALASTVTYDFSADAAVGVVTPATIAAATFSSPSDPGAYAFGPNGDLFTNLGPNVLSSAGAPTELDIRFSMPQYAINFDFALGDFLAFGGSDTLTLSPNVGSPRSFTANLVGSDFYPEGSVSLPSTTGFNSVAITSAYPIVIADLRTVPEPASMALFGIGLASLAVTRRRRARARWCRASANICGVSWTPAMTRARHCSMLRRERLRYVSYCQASFK